ncbi:MAG TPA: glycosyltransferase family 4 protein [Candidatus Paceibacterota bacterium]|nr:glycosyltransferase family 4 protein [Candidatus Paceibacterota bacterium]
MEIHKDIRHTRDIMRRLLVATPLYPPQIGGPATYTIFLEKHLSQYGYKCCVVPFVRVLRYPKILRHILYTCMIVWHARDADMLYALDPVSVGLPVCIASFITRKPYLLRVPGDYAWEQGQQRFGVTQNLDEFVRDKKQSFMVRVLRWVQCFVARGARHIIVPSAYLKGIVIAWGIIPERVTPIYSVLKEINVPETKESLRKQYHFGDEIIITSAGRLVPWKGFQILIEVIATFRQRGIPTRLYIIGDGVCRSSLEAHAHALGVAREVVFCGALSRDEMARYIKASDVFVLNTAYEGLSHQLLEVMSLGTPIITTRIGGNPELIVDGVTGKMVAYNDSDAFVACLTAYHESPQEYYAYAEEAKKSVRRFHEDIIVRNLITLLQNVWKS